MKLSLVIPTHDRPTELARLLNSLGEQSRLPEEVLVVNDGAGELSAGVLQPLRSAGVTVRVLRRSPPPSSAASRNAGLAEASGDVVFCLDDDTLLGPALLAELLELYRRDPAGRIGGIGIPYREVPSGPGGRAWAWFFRLSGRVRYRPMHVASRYVRLPAGLRGRLRPAWMLPGGSLSLRGQVARVARFDERLGGYAFGEDRELVYRLGRRWALFEATRLRVDHRPGSAGRGDWRQRGRAYVRNMLHVVRNATDPGAGTWTLLAVDFAAAMLQYALWALPGRGGGHLRFARGLLDGIATELREDLRRCLCGR